MSKNSSQNNTLKNRRITNIILGFVLAIFVFVPFVQNDLKAEGEVTLYVDINAETEATSRTDDNATFKTIANALSFASNGDTIQLISNVTENVIIREDLIVTIDLNGFILSTTSGTVITNNGSLTIKDSNSNSDHYFTVNDNGLWVWNDGNTTNAKNFNSLTVKPVKDDVILVKGGCITGGAGVYGGAIYNASNKTVNLNGGVLIGNTSEDGCGVYNYGVLNMNNASIIGNYATNRGGAIQNYGTILLTGSDLNYNTASKFGGAICNDGDAILTNCKLQNNSVILDDTVYGGGAINFDGDGNATLSLDGCTITGNKGKNGGGVRYSGKLLTVKGNTIIKNNTSIDGTSINNVLVCNSKKITIENPGSLMSIGINTQTIPIYGTPVSITSSCSADYSSYFESDNNKYFVLNTGSDSSQILILDVAIAKIGDTIFSSVQDAINASTDGQTVQMLQNSIESIVVNSNKIVTINLNGCVLEGAGTSSIKKSVIYIKGSKVTITDNSSDKYNYFTYYKNQPWVWIENHTPSATDVLFDGNTDINSLVSGLTIIKVKGGVITGGNGTAITGMGGYHGGGICISSYGDSVGQLFFNSGNIIGNTSTIGGGISALTYQGTGQIVQCSLTLSGGNVIGNYSEENAGGVELQGKADCSLSNGFISYNISNPSKSYYGGGILVSDSCSLNITGGCISYNNAYYGGGVYTGFASGNSVVTMTSGSISNNKSDYGGGVYIGFYDKKYHGKFKLNGGTISNNLADYGGGIYNCAELIMTNGIINNNNALYEGGGAYVGWTYALDVRFDMSGGSISNNTSDTGAGVYVDHYSDPEYYGNFNLSGGSIKSNVASSKAGGVMLNGGKLNLSGSPDVSDNSAIYNSSFYTSNVFLKDTVINNIINTFNGNVGIMSSSMNSSKDFENISNANSADYSLYFFCDSEKYCISNSGNGSNQILQLRQCVAEIGNVGYPTVQKAVDAAASGQTVKLIKDSVENIIVDEADNITLNLNGHILSQNTNTAIDRSVNKNGSVITNKGNLTIIDSNPTAVHKFKVQTFDNNKCIYWSLVDNSLNSDCILSDQLNVIPAINKIITVYGGCITGGNGTNGKDNFNSGGGVKNTSTAKLYFNSGNICGNLAGEGGGIANDGLVYVNGGVLAGNSGWQLGGGIVNYSTGKVSIINNSKLLCNSGYLGGSAISNSGKLYINDNNYLNSDDDYSYVNICLNTSVDNNGSYGGAIGNWSGNSCVYAFKCKVNNNVSNKMGGALFNVAGSVYLTDCEFKNNVSYKYGGAIVTKGSLVLDDVIITDNTSKFNNDIGLSGGGVFIQNAGTLTVSNNTKIINNKFEQYDSSFSTLLNTYTNNITLMSDTCKIGFSDNFDGDIGITLHKTKTQPTNTAPITISDKNYSIDFSLYVFSDSLDYEINNFKNGSNNLLKLTAPTICEITANESILGNKYSSISSAINDAGTTATTVKLIKDCKESISIASGKTITLDLNGYVLKGNGETRVVLNNGNLSIVDSNSTTKHYFKVDDNLWLIQDVNNIDTNQAVCLNSLSSRPSKNTIVEILGGCITGGDTLDYADVNGAGISNQKANGGNNPVLSITGGNIIGNKNGYNLGGGIYNDLNGTVTITGTNIVGNFSWNAGGISNEGSLDLVNSNISYNTCMDNGGGIQNVSKSDNTCVFNLDNSKISGNFATQYSGAGIYNQGTLNVINNTVIINNKTSSYAKNGGGIYNTSNSYAGSGVVYIKNSTISDNEACAGAGIYNNGTSLTLEGNCVINNNKIVDSNVKNNVYLANGKFISLGNNGLSTNAKVGVVTQSLSYNDVLIVSNGANLLNSNIIIPDNKKQNLWTINGNDNLYFFVKRNITLSDLTFNNKVYDGNTTGTVTFSKIKGIVLDDLGNIEVNVASANFDNSNVGNNKSTVVNFELTGDPDVVRRYNVPSSVTNLIASITHKEITVKAKDITLNKGDSLPNELSDYIEPIDGIINDYQITYVVTPISDTNTAGCFRTIVNGDVNQNNYHINFVNGSVNVVDNSANVMAKTDPAILSKVLDQYMDDYPGKLMTIDLSVDNASGSAEEQMILNEAGVNNEIDSYESKIFISLLDGSEIKLDVTDTGHELIPIEYNFNFECRYDIHVWRVHDYGVNSVVEEITVVPNSDGEYVVYNYTDKMISVWAKKYSTYSVTYKELVDSEILDTNYVPSYQPVKTCVD